MDLDTMLAQAAPARHEPLDGPDSPAAASLYRRIIAAPSTPPSRRRGAAALGLAGAAAATAAAIVITLAAGPPPGAHRRGAAQPAALAAWSVTSKPHGLVAVTIRQLRDPRGLQRRLAAAGIPANVRFLPHPFTPTTSPYAIPSSCRAPHLPDKGGALLQARIMPRVPPGPPVSGTTGQAGNLSWGIDRDQHPGVVLYIRPSAIPPGIGLALQAWAASPGTRNGPMLDLQANLVLASPPCTRS